MTHMDGDDGLIRKFKVERLTPSSRGIDHTRCEYFVLDPLHDPIARQVLSRYAEIADQVGDKALASDMYKWLSDLATNDVRNKSNGS